MMFQTFKLKQNYSNLWLKYGIDRKSEVLGGR